MWKFLIWWGNNWCEQGPSPTLPFPPLVRIYILFFSLPRGLSLTNIWASYGRSELLMTPLPITLCGPILHTVVRGLFREPPALQESEGKIPLPSPNGTNPTHQHLFVPANDSSAAPCERHNICRSPWFLFSKGVSAADYGTVTRLNWEPQTTVSWWMIWSRSCTSLFNLHWLRSSPLSNAFMLTWRLLCFDPLM